MQVDKTSLPQVYKDNLKLSLLTASNFIKKQDIYTGVTKLKKQQTVVFAKEFSNIKKELEKYPQGTRPDLEEKMDVVKTEIEKICPVSQALTSYQETKETISSLDLEWKNIKNEILILQRLLDEDLEIPEMAHEKLQVPEPELKKEALNEKQEYGKLTRITINEKLFASQFEDVETYMTRIPYKKSFVKFDKQNCQLQNDGTILSVYIYDNMEYTVSDADGKTEKKIAGKDLKHFYEDKTRKKQKGKDMR